MNVLSNVGAFIPVPTLPAGVPFFVPATQVTPNGVLECNGQTFLATSYPELAKVYPSLTLPSMSGTQGGVAGKWFCYVSNLFYDMKVDGGNANYLGGHPPEYYASATALANTSSLLGSNLSLLPDHIVEGKKFTYSSGLTLGVTAGKTKIGNSVVEKAADSITLQPKRLGLLLEDGDGILSAQYAVDPMTFVDANTVALWKPDGSVTCPNLAVGVNGNTLAVANDLTKIGTVTAVDGIFGNNAAQGDGSTGGYGAANIAGIPVGSNAIALHVGFIVNAIPAATQMIANISYNTSGTKNFGMCLAPTTGELQLLYGSTPTIVGTGYITQTGGLYDVWFVYNGSTSLSVYVNGAIVNVLTITALNTDSTCLLNLLCRGYASNQYRSPATLLFAEVKNNNPTAQQIAEQAAKMLSPVCWTDVDGNRKNITSTLPANTISLGMVRTSASGVLAYDDATWQWGRREKAANGNRRAFLTFTYYSGAKLFTWNNPFGVTPKVAISQVWASDANGTGECRISDDASYSFNQQSQADKLSVYVGTNGAMVGLSALKTSGYIGCYVEVLEDD